MISSLGMICFSASSSPLTHGRLIEAPNSMTPPSTGTKADDPMRYSSASFARSELRTFFTSGAYCAWRARITLATGDSPSMSYVTACDISA